MVTRVPNPYKHSLKLFFIIFFISIILILSSEYMWRIEIFNYIEPSQIGFLLRYGILPLLQTPSIIFIISLIYYFCMIKIYNMPSNKKSIIYIIVACIITLGLLDLAYLIIYELFWFRLIRTIPLILMNIHILIFTILVVLSRINFKSLKLKIIFCKESVINYLSEYISYLAIPLAFAVINYEMMQPNNLLGYDIPIFGGISIYYPFPIIMAVLLYHRINNFYRLYKWQYDNACKAIENPQTTIITIDTLKHAFAFWVNEHTVEYFSKVDDEAAGNYISLPRSIEFLSESLDTCYLLPSIAQCISYETKENPIIQIYHLDENYAGFASKRCCNHFMKLSPHAYTVFNIVQKEAIASRNIETSEYNQFFNLPTDEFLDKIPDICIKTITNIKVFERFHSTIKKIRFDNEFPNHLNWIHQKIKESLLKEFEPIEAYYKMMKIMEFMIHFNAINILSDTYYNEHIIELIDNDLNAPSIGKWLSIGENTLQDSKVDTYYNWYKGKASAESISAVRFVSNLLGIGRTSIKMNSDILQSIVSIRNKTIGHGVVTYDMALKLLETIGMIFADMIEKYTDALEKSKIDALNHNLVIDDNNGIYLFTSNIKGVKEYINYKTGNILTEGKRKYKLSKEKN